MAAFTQCHLDVRSSIDIDPTGKPQRSVARSQINPESTGTSKQFINSKHCEPCTIDCPTNRPPNPAPLGRIPSRTPVFGTLGGQPKSASCARAILKLLAFNAGIDKPIHTHAFRHTHAAHLRTEVVDIAIISQLLGHLRIDITARYLNQIAPTPVIAAMRGRNWITA